MSEQPQYKLTYFDLRAIGEPIRFMFVYKQVEFENDEVNHLEWPSIKPSMFFFVYLLFSPLLKKF